MDLIRPIVWNEKGISNTLIALNKICVESINIDSLRAQIINLNPIINLRGLKGLKLFERYLELISTKDESMEIMNPFFVLYDLRQSISHLMSITKKKEILYSCFNRVGINYSEDLEKLYEKLIELIINSYNRILRICQAL